MQTHAGVSGVTDSPYKRCSVMLQAMVVQIIQFKNFELIYQ